MTQGPLRGFRDYPPPLAGARSEIRRRMRAAARRAGYTELEVPAVESFELYQRKSGEEIAAQAWQFLDKGDRQVALIPEQTPSLARIFVERGKSEPLPVKWFTASRSWRYEEPQAGRTREFFQFNLDIVGVPGLEAEVDLLSTAALVLDEVGASGLYVIRLNDRAVAEGLGRAYGATDAARFFRAVDRFRKASPQEFRGELEAAGVAPDRAGEAADLLRSSGAGVPPGEAPALLAGLSARGFDAAANEGVQRLLRLLGLLERVGLADRVVYDPTVVRGIAYYTSTVFEVFARRGEGRSVAGGGRYDQLIELFGGPPTPAAGLAIGDQTLEILLRDGGRWPDGEPPLDTYVVIARPELAPEGFALVERLRRSGVSADGDLLGRSLSRQLREAARRKCRRALIVGLREASPGAVVERDLSTGAQRELAPGAL
ncbi:MAG TPA: histidine--tRNA ligase [Thermoplasmata archaeon]|nr:histidine--tRNA ligase [Thermoplasmata archaeon]